MKPVIIINNYRKVDKLLLVDRDGTLIKDLPNRKFLNIKEIYQRQFYLIHQLQKIALESKETFGVVIISNQSIIGRKIITFDVLMKIMLIIEKFFSRFDIPFLGIIYCPHTTDLGCECRKPNTQMLQLANYIWATNVCSQVFWGNTKSDYLAGLKAKIPTILTMDVNRIDKKLFGKSQGDKLLEKTRKHFNI